MLEFSKTIDTSDPTGELARLRESAEFDYEANIVPNSARALAEAERSNLDVVYPKANELQIDIDSTHALYIYEIMRGILDRHYGILSEDITPSRSGFPKRHITLRLFQDLTNMERIALQACMGSDRVREILSVIQERNKDPHATLFLEKKTDAPAKAPVVDDDIPF